MTPFFFFYFRRFFIFSCFSPVYYNAVLVLFTPLQSSELLDFKAIILSFDLFPGIPDNGALPRARHVQCVRADRCHGDAVHRSGHAQNLAQHVTVGVRIILPALLRSVDASADRD